MEILKGWNHHFRKRNSRFTNYDQPLDCDHSQLYKGAHAYLTVTKDITEKQFEGNENSQGLTAVNYLIYATKEVPKKSPK